MPQGSILGPLLFLVYINDLTVDLRCDVKLFADDTSLFTIVENASDAAIDLNHDLDLIQQWALQWRMSFNPDPQQQAVEMLFSRRHIAIDHPEIRFNNIPVMKVSEHKHLGVILDSKLSFSAHINAAISKARRGIGGLRLPSRYLPRSSLCEIYKLHIRPHLDSVMSFTIFRPKFTNSEVLTPYLALWKILSRSNIQLLSLLRVHGRGHRGTDYTKSLVGSHSILEDGPDR